MVGSSLQIQYSKNFKSFLYPHVLQQVTFSFLAKPNAIRLNENIISGNLQNQKNTVEYPKGTFDRNYILIEDISFSRGDFKDYRPIHWFVGEIACGGIDKGCILMFLLTISLMYMPKDMKLRLNLFNLLKQGFASGIQFFCILIQDSEWRAVSYHNIYFLWYTFPQIISIFLCMHKSPIKKFKRVRTAENYKAFDFYCFMFEINTNLFKFFYFFLSIYFYQLSLVLFNCYIGLIKGEIMVTSNNYFMLVRQHGEKLTKTSMLIRSRSFGKISRMYEDISFRHILHVYFMMSVMSV